MREFALLINDEFKEIRQYDTKPVNIPHKDVVWLDVVRQTGNTAFTANINNTWVIQTTPSVTPTPTVVSARQARLALLNNNLLDEVNVLVSTQPKSVQITWEYATEVRRDDQILNQLAINLNLTEEDLDNLFVEASQI